MRRTHDFYRSTTGWVHIDFSNALNALQDCLKKKLQKKFVILFFQILFLPISE